MQEQTIFHRINDLAQEEERLYQEAGDGGGLDDADQDRLAEINVALDQCYDFLAQRRARRAAGLDPEQADVRPPDVVEGYQQ